MEKISIPQFAGILNGVAEVFGAKQVTPKGLELWFETLREFSENEVFAALNSWPKTHTKFPVPADVWKALNENASRRREDVAEAEKKMFAEGLNRAMATPAGARSMALIRQILSRPKPSPREHWRRVMETEGLPPIAYKFASDFLNKDKEAA